MTEEEWLTGWMGRPVWEWALPVIIMLAAIVAVLNFAGRSA